MSWYERNKRLSQTMSNADRSRFSRNAFLGSAILCAFLSFHAYWIPMDRTSTGLASMFQIFKVLIAPLAGKNSASLVYGAFSILCVILAYAEHVKIQVKNNSGK